MNLSLSESEIERLAILTEECAEVQQLAMKIVRHGYNSHNPFDDSKEPNRRLLEKEIGHLLFALQLMVENHDLNEAAITGFQQAKRESIQKYLHFNTAIPVKL